MCYTMVTHSFEQLLDGVTDHPRRYCLIIRAVMDSGWWVWLLKNTTASFSFLLLLLLLCSSRQAALLHFPCPVGLCSKILKATYTSVVLHPFGHYAFSSTTSLTLNLNFPFFSFFMSLWVLVPWVILWPWCLHPSSISTVYSWSVVDIS